MTFVNCCYYFFFSSCYFVRLPTSSPWHSYVCAELCVYFCLFVRFLLVHRENFIRCRCCYCCSILLLSTFVKFFVFHIKYYFLYCILIASIAHNTHAHTYIYTNIYNGEKETQFLEWSTFTMMIVIIIM